MNADRITALEARLAAAEARIALLEARPVQPVPPMFWKPPYQFSMQGYNTPSPYKNPSYAKDWDGNVAVSSVAADA